MLALTHLDTFHGPNLWADEPVVTAKLTVADPSGFDEAAALLTEYCTGWFARPAASSADQELAAGEFIARWARDMLNRQQGRIVAAGAARNGPDVIVFLGYHQPRATQGALALGARLLTEFRELDEQSARNLLTQFWAKTRPTHPDYQAALLIEYARRNNLPWRRLNGEDRLWFYGWGARGTVKFESKPMMDSYLGSRWAQDKVYSKGIFRDLGAPTADGVLVRDEKDLPKAAERVGFPCVAKPVDGHLSHGVTAYLRSLAELRAAFADAAAQSGTGRVMVERHVEGEVVRLLVFRGEFRWAIRRSRPVVIADGHSTVAELRAEFNRSRHRLRRDGPRIGPAPDDTEFRTTLGQQGLRPEDVPAAGRALRLRNVPRPPNRDADVTDWLYDDVTATLHPDTRQMAEALARYFHIEACGLDYITADPAVSCHRQGAFVEINATPSLGGPLIVGVPADELCSAVFGDDVGRVPSLLVVAAPELRDDVVRRLPADGSLGWASGQTVGLGATTLSGRRQDVHSAAKSVLRNPLTRAVVIIATADEITRLGLPADRFDRAVVLTGSGLDDPWRSVLRRCAAAYEETDDLGELQRAIATLGRA